MHKRFVDLASPGTRFVQALAANLGEKSPFPGGSYFCLQILAFWLSLVRYFYCEQKVLRLGAGLMAILEEWATTPGLPEEELELAAKLHATMHKPNYYLKLLSVIINKNSLLSRLKN